MKKYFLGLSFGLLVLASCQPDTLEDDSPTPLTIDFIGTWDRDSVLLNEIDGGGNRTRVESEANEGWYKFNTGNTGILHLSSGDYAINWNYNATAGTILISEIDWVNQTYSLTTFSPKQIKLIGKRSIGGGVQEERVLYLSKR
ncbi:MAG: hypothetical protein FGM41_12895 [Bacteroidetes bacterium]|jgi:hypothetical protein|nr:hypothetical protein [Bacteroidota bacterium]